MFCCNFFVGFVFVVMVMFVFVGCVIGFFDVGSSGEFVVGDEYGLIEVGILIVCLDVFYLLFEVEDFDFEIGYLGFDIDLFSVIVEKIDLKFVV